MASIVIVVENLPVPFDRRVWQEAQALRAAGWRVSVICPKSARYPDSYEELDGIAIYRHPLPLEARGKLAFVVEYTSALFHETRLLLRVFRERGFDVIQGCNPPDLIFLPALIFKLFGKRYIFDHHDVCPELLSAKFGQKGFVYRVLLILERLSFASADAIITANETFREIAMTRGRQPASKVTTVYSIPDRKRIYRIAPPNGVKSSGEVVLGYIGIIGDQDGVDHLVRAVAHLVKQSGLSNIRAIVIGDGPALVSAKQLALVLNINSHITFTGYLSGTELLAQLSALDIGIIPDPMNVYNDKISMNKVFEYSALGIPSVSYPLTETMRLLGDAGSYASGGEPEDLAAACLPLINSAETRQRQGQRAQELADRSFNWDHEAERYVAACEGLMVRGTR